MQSCKRTIFFIDGLNVYHAIKNSRFNKYKWLDYWELSKVIPVGGKAHELAQVIGSSVRMKEVHLRTSQLPNTVTLKNGVVLQRPREWS